MAGDVRGENMKAILSLFPGPPDELVLREIKSPKPEPNQVIVRVMACGVNYLDALIIQDLYQHKPTRPFSPGGDIAGIVKEAGAAAHKFKVGDEVFGQIPFGGFAEEAAVDEALLFHKPAGVGFKEASSFLMVYSTVFHGLKDRAGIRPGETVVVLGAAGGIGLAAVELG
ncbi:MAG: alcohol dehydrogenase catalytic domain-containing protein, partial [Okeania sp. SIO3B3]|nr:alcohol dehydrogenase catalytic domain-containing protein [Okeania sp. SIO3B3]